MKRKLPPALILLFLAPLLGELISGHLKPSEFFHPLIFILMALPYGLGALVCRELSVRWNRGWLSFLLLALAFGVYEEGIVVRSFFNQNWGELGNLKDYNYFAGINWTYSIMLVHFHVLISIFSSVKLAELLYPERKSEPWLSDKMLSLTIIGLVLWLPWGWKMTGFIPPPVHHIGVYLLCGALIYLARFLPERLCFRRNEGLPPKRVPSIIFLLVGLLNVVTLFATVFILPEKELYLPLAGVVAFLVLLNLGTLLLLVYLSGSFAAWNDRQILALIVGLNLFFIVTGFDEEKEAAAAVISLLSLAGSALLYFLVRKRELAQEKLFYSEE